jgi:hypothetical protein
MKIAIHQPQYMPWTGYFHKMAGADLFVLLDDVQFKKNEWQHRNRIRNRDGFQWLSVPNTYTFGQRIMDVRIKHDQDWEAGHLRSLEMCYARAAHYGEYADAFREYYQVRRDTMDVVAADSVRLLKSLLGITTPLEISSAFNFEGVSTQRLINICRHFGADTYLAGAGGHAYMDVSLFKKEGIEVEFQQFIPPVYDQRWSTGPGNFVAGLSAIDVIFNCGKVSLDLILGKR